MSYTIKVYTDEQVSRALIRGLRNRGVDVLSVPEAGMRGKSDEEHLEFARSKERVILTRDADFLQLASAIPDHAGILYARQGLPIGKIIHRTVQIWEDLDLSDFFGRVDYIS